MKLADEVFQAELGDIDRRRRTVALDRPERNPDDHTRAEEAAFGRALKALDKLKDAKEKADRLQQEPSGFERLVQPVFGVLANRAARVTKGRPAGAEDSEENKASDTAASAKKSPEEERKEAEHEVDVARQKAAVVATPSTALGLAGLALSGGGIRSATFNLGVLQAFCKRGLFERFDYLSTVSGGSYIGGMMTSLLSNNTVRISAEDFPLRHGRGSEESPEMKHLRSGGRYLAPGGVIDKVRIPALFLRGLLVNLVLLLPDLIGAAVLTEWAYGAALRPAYTAILNRQAEGPVPLTAYSIASYGPTVIMATVLIAWALVFPWIRRVTMNWAWRNGFEHAFSLWFLATVVVAAINTLPSVMLAFRSRDFSLNVVASGGIATLVTIGAPLLPLLLASGTPRPLNTWQGKVMIALLGLIGPLILLLLYVQIATWRVFCVDGNVPECPDWWLFEVTRLDRLLPGWTLLGLKPIDFGLGLVAAVLFVYGWRTVDVNLTSLHGFYRDRLSRAYLFRWAAKSSAGPVLGNDELRLSDIAPEGSRAPYHLVNATLNLQASRTRQGRPADFFLFSKRFVGSSVTGYMPTAEIEKLDRRLDLASAVAVSGAALAPNMGTSTNRALVFIMTLLNVRTGYWLPNPLAGTLRIRALRGVGPAHLLLELFGLVHEKSAFVNVSDGGHLENLGLYELVRRRCRYIVVCDAEADDELKFDGLGKVIRYARIDGGVEIDLKADRLRKATGDVSTSHYALGHVRYKDGTDDGLVIYLKATLCPSETEDIRAYLACNRRPNQPAFPHESTSRQFFDEGQFEAYRALGYHVADTLLEAGKFHEGMTLNELVMNLGPAQKS
jgi:hypothetical protein